MRKKDPTEVGQARTSNWLGLATAVGTLLLAVIGAFSLGHQASELDELRDQFKRDTATIRLTGTFYVVDRTAHKNFSATRTSPQLDGHKAPYAFVYESRDDVTVGYRFDMAITNIGARVAYVDNLFGQYGARGKTCHEEPWGSTRGGSNAPIFAGSCADLLGLQAFRCTSSNDRKPTPCKLPFEVLPGEVKEVTVDMTPYIKVDQLPYCETTDEIAEGLFIVDVATSADQEGDLDESVDPDERPYVGNKVALQLVRDTRGCEGNRKYVHEGP